MRRIEYVNKNPLAAVTIILPCRSKREIVHSYPKECEVLAVIGNEPPGVLRDYGVEYAHGEYLAFIDADAYPSSFWLSNVFYYFIDTEAEAVCGPGVLPEGSSFREWLSDVVLRLMPFNYRVLEKRSRWVAEYPTFNLIVRRRVFRRIGGFGAKKRGTDGISGEDTLFCRKLSRIFYHPNILVYHKRRPLGIPFFRQISRFGRNRGVLVALAFPIIPIAFALTCLVYIINFLIGLVKWWGVR